MCDFNWQLAAAELNSGFSSNRVNIFAIFAIFLYTIDKISRLSPIIIMCIFFDLWNLSEFSESLREYLCKAKYVSSDLNFWHTTLSSHCNKVSCDLSFVWVAFGMSKLI